MNNLKKKLNSVAVTSRSFSKHPVLRKELSNRYHHVRFNDEGISLSGDTLVNFLKGHDKSIIALENINDTILSQLPELKVISKYGVGLDMIDLNAMNQYGLKLGWQGGINKRSVSELVISHTIALLHRVVFANTEVRKGKWYQVKGRQLSDKTVGIIGCGHIGKDLVKLLQPFQCNILAHDILNYETFYKQYNVTPVSLEYLLENSDVVTLHLPLDNTTKNILNNDHLQLLKRHAILINLARGGLIDETALKIMLSSGKLAGAALDVFAIEPPIDSGFPLLDNVLITPHIGGSTEEAILSMGMAAIENLEHAKNPLEFL